MKMSKSVVARIWKTIRKRFRDSKVRPIKEITELIRSGSPEELAAMDSTPEDALDPPAPLHISSVFKIKDPVDFYEQLWRNLRAKVEANKESWKGLNPSEKAVLAVWALQCEVNNGGFDQYFFNPTGDHAHEVVPALRLIGATELADIAGRARAVFPGGAPSPNRKTRWKQADKIEEKAKPIWKALNQEFYESGEKLHELVFRYANKHPREFGA